MAVCVYDGSGWRYTVDSATGKLARSVTVVLNNSASVAWAAHPGVDSVVLLVKLRPAG